MTKLQLIVVSISFFLFLVLYFGLDNKPSNHASIEKARSIATESTDINALLIGAKPDLSSQQAAFILSLEKQIGETSSDSIRTKLYKDLSGKWYEFGHAEIAGFYAEQAADLDNTEDAWSITGTTYLLGARQAKEDKIKSFCTKRAISAFESAISLNPSNINHKVNLATCYAENPPKENPMKGVMMLLDMNKENPESVPVLVSLGRFGIETGQYDKASERLKKAVQLDANHRNANCLLAKALSGLGKLDEAAVFETKCKTLALQ